MTQNSECYCQDLAICDSCIEFQSGKNLSDDAEKMMAEIREILSPPIRPRSIEYNQGARYWI